MRSLAASRHGQPTERLAACFDAEASQLLLPATQRGEPRAMVFMCDSTADGLRFRILALIDTFNPVRSGRRR